MKFNYFFLGLLTLALSFQACNNDDDGDTPEPEESPITEQNVRAVFNFIPPQGYETSGYTENFPDAVTGFYKETSIDQNVNVSAVQNLSGDVIVVDDFTVESSFVMPDEIKESDVNGTTVYQAMEESSYRAVIFRGQYRFDIVVLNDPDPAVAEAEASKFIDLMTQAMSTF